MLTHNFAHLRTKYNHVTWTGVGSARSGVNLHHQQTAMAGNTSSPETVKCFNPVRAESTQLLFLNLNFSFTILKVNVYSTVTNINHLPYANFSSIVWWIKMTIFIIFKRHVVGWLKIKLGNTMLNLRDHRVSHCIARCILLCTFIYALFVYKGAQSHHKESAK